MADQAQYMRVYRQTNSRERLSRQARQKAAQRLLNEQSDRYAELVDEERRKLGLPTRAGN